MGIQLSALQRVSSGGPLQAWVEYPHVAGFALRLEFVDQEETEAFYGLKGGEARDVSEEEFRDWHLERVKDWRGVEDGDAPAPLDREVLRGLWQRDGRFRPWLVGRCRDLACFLGTEDEAPAVAVGAGGD